MITIIGAGKVGGSAALHCAIKQLDDQFLLLDIAEGLPQGEAMDLNHLLSEQGIDVEISGSNNYEDMKGADIVVGYKYTLDVIADLIKDKKIHVITMADQEKTYQHVKKELGDVILVNPFTGDVNFTESEVVDRLIEIFGDVELVPGISSIQVAASKAQVPLDKSKVITMHVTTSIEEKK